MYVVARHCQGHIAHGTSWLHHSVQSLRDLHSLRPLALGVPYGPAPHDVTYSYLDPSNNKYSATKLVQKNFRHFVQNKFLTTKISQITVANFGLWTDTGFTSIRNIGHEQIH